MVKFGDFGLSDEMENVSTIIPGQNDDFGLRFDSIRGARDPQERTLHGGNGGYLERGDHAVRAGEQLLALRGRRTRAELGSAQNPVERLRVPEGTVGGNQGSASADVDGGSDQVDHRRRITISEIKSHPWFYDNEFLLSLDHQRMVESLKNTSSRLQEVKK